MSEQQIQEHDELLNKSQTELAMIILMIGITPVISAIGIVGNVCSVIVLKKQGMRKNSNILLLALAVSDIMYLLGFNSVPKIIYTIHGNHSFPYSQFISEVLFVCFQIFLIMDYSSGNISVTLPMFITIERLVKVFFPFTVSRMITPRIIWISVSFVFLFWYTNIIYAVIWFELNDESHFENRSVRTITRSALFAHDKSVVFTIEEVWSTLSLRIPPVFTFIGCVLIGIKITCAVKKRREKLGKKTDETSMFRTTKTLLAVCGMYTVTCIVMSLPVIIPQKVSFLLTDEKMSRTGEVIYQIINLAVCLNCSSNFVIYIVFNKNFRETYIKLFVKDKKYPVDILVNNIRRRSTRQLNHPN